MKKLLQDERFPGWLAAIAALAVYLGTMAPSIASSDGGELAAAASTLGVAHPTGYPLFTLLGRVFSVLPLGEARVIWKLNLMAALCTALAVHFLYRFLLLLLARTAGGTSRAASDRLAAALAALALAFSRTFWSQAVAVEVYSLHLLLLSLALWLFLAQAPARPRGPGSGSLRGWLLFAYVLGLGFANHLTMILILPGLIYLYFASHGFSKPAWVKLSRAVPPFLLGLTIYLYLPLRAARQPAMNWGDPSSWEAFLAHATGAQYRDIMFSSWAAALSRLRDVLAGFPAEFGYAPLIPAAIGVLSLFRRSRALGIFSGMLFAGCLLYAVNYDIPDIGAYFLLAYLAAAVWIAFGIRALLARAPGRARFPAAAGACAVFVLVPLLLNHRAADRSGDYAAEDYVKNVMGPLDPGAVLLTDQDDYLAWTAFYLQLVEGFRTDVLVVDAEFLSFPWYHRQLRDRHPELAAGVGAEIRAQLSGYPDPARAPLDHLGAAATRGLALGSLGYRPLYMTYNVNFDLFPEFRYVPAGLALRFIRDSFPAPGPLRLPAWRPLPRHATPYRGGIRRNYALALFNDGSYRDMWGDSASAVLSYRLALEAHPGYEPAVQRLKR